MLELLPTINGRTLLFVMIRLALEDGKGALELLGEYGANNLMREGHLR